MRFFLALLCMFIAVSSSEHWPLMKCLLWGFAWTGAAGVIIWPWIEWDVIDAGDTRRDTNNTINHN